MSDLRSRVKKSKELVWSHSPRNPGHYGTRGSGKSNGERYYNVDLSHSKTVIATPDGKKSVRVLQANCRADIGGALIACPDCKFNNAVCKHSLGALYESFKQSGKLISFFETYEGALQRRFSGKIVKVESIQGKGFAWAVIKEWPVQAGNCTKLNDFQIISDAHEATCKQDKTYPTVQILSAKCNIDLMRGREDDEGID